MAEMSDGEHDSYLHRQPLPPPDDAGADGAEAGGVAEGRNLPMKSASEGSSGSTAPMRASSSSRPARPMPSSIAAASAPGGPGTADGSTGVRDSRQAGPTVKKGSPLGSERRRLRPLDRATSLSMASS
jgi:hypothetical protein